MTMHRPSPPEEELVAAIAARTGLSEQTVALARWTAEHAQTFRTADDYMDSWPWFPFERADRPDSAVRW